jgi:aldehyde dehydrogenase (NAD+)
MHPVLKELGVPDPAPGVICGETTNTDPGAKGAGALLDSINPANGELLGRVRQATRADYDETIRRSQAAFENWRVVPAPQRGEIVRQIGEELRRFKEPLGKLVTLEMGKIATEGQGEVQEMIDIADFAVGLSRQLYGLSMHSERPSHRMYEQWHPLGIVGIISAFNFPTAVWAWNAMIAAVCGDSMVWKPSHKTPLCAIASQRIATRVLAKHGHPDVMALLIGATADVGEPMLDDRRVPLISATGSCNMGKVVGERIARRFGRSLLELGGNNGIVVLDDADLDLALRAVLFGAVGTAGQRCTSTRRVFLQRGVAAKFTERLVKAYASVKIGDPSDPATLMGPLVDAGAVNDYVRALEQIRKEGGEVLRGGRVLKDGPLAKGCFVEPTIVRARGDLPMLRHETFAPILYLIEVKDVDEAIALHNDVPQGLSSAIFTLNLRSAERFLAHAGSDCGIANVNIGTSGAEIGGAFGGEKDTGGGREAGSDSWKAYMRRQTCTINWSRELPLAQGVKFDVSA